MNAYEQKQESKRERLEARAERLSREGAAKVESGMERLRQIPFGQPILVGHHSEKRDRSYRRRAGNSIDRGMELQKEAAEVAARAASVGSGGISSDDPDAVVKLKEKLAKMQETQARMVAANKVVRKFKADVTAGVQALVASGYPQSIAAGLFTPDCCGRLGFPSYALTNNSGNMRRVEQRIQELSRAENRETKEVLHNSGVKLVENADINRVQLIFPGKPPAETRTLLKQHGFRWSPSEGAWQRHLNGSGTWAAKCVLERLTPS